MYTIKPTYDDFNIELPKCMYEVKVSRSFLSELQQQEENNFDTKSNTCAIGGADFDNLNCNIKSLLKSSGKMDLLEARQQNLLQELKKFKIRLLEVRKKLTSKLPAITPTTSTISTSSSQTATESYGTDDKSLSQFDIVINAHPKYVPYGLLAIKNAWKNINFIIKVFSHSTLSDVGPEAKHFQKLITTTDENGYINNDKLPTIQLTLIWKNCEHTEMISSPTKYKPIYGEINILRYLARIGPIDYRYDNQANANFIDAILDICYQLLRVSTTSGQNELLNYLNDRLLLDGKQRYFGGNNCSIADIAVASTIKRLPQNLVKNLPKNLQIWHTTIKNIVLL